MPTKAKPMPDDQTLAGVKKIIANLKRTKKGSLLARRRRAEAIERYESWLPELERKEAAKAYEARQRQIQENAERLRAETQTPKQSQEQTPQEIKDALSRIAGYPVGPTVAEKRKRICFYFYNSDSHFIRDPNHYNRLLPVKVEKRGNSVFDAADGEPLKVVDSYPAPCAGATLQDDGNWKLPEVKHPVIAPLPPMRDPVMIGWQPHPEKVAAEKLAEKIRKLGYQATVGSSDNRAYVLYDERWIGVTEWKVKMGIEL